MLVAGDCGQRSHQCLGLHHPVPAAARHVRLRRLTGHCTISSWPGIALLSMEAVVGAVVSQRAQCPCFATGTTIITSLSRYPRLCLLPDLRQNMRSGCAASEDYQDVHVSIVTSISVS